MKAPFFAFGIIGTVGLAAASLFVWTQVKSAQQRLEHPPTKDNSQVAAVADHAEAPYCTPQFKTVLQRVLNACGLVGQETRRGCQPADVKTIASINDEDFNALFTPLSERGAILLFDDASDKLDDEAKKLLQDRWEDRRGARYFFIVSRASKTGSTDGNRSLSHKRANSVMFFLQETTKEPNLEKMVGMLWLGSEYAQLGKDYCSGWSNSRGTGKPCTTDAINRSAFTSWVDCRL